MSASLPQVASNDSSPILGEAPRKSCELRLLELFLNAPGQIFSKSKLADRLFSYDDDVSALEDQKIDVGALEDQLEIAKAYEAELKRLAEESNRLGEIYEAELKEEKGALDAASGGRELSDAALAALREKLGL